MSRARCDDMTGSPDNEKLMQGMEIVIRLAGHNAVCCLSVSPLGKENAYAACSQKYFLSTYITGWLDSNLLKIANCKQNNCRCVCCRYCR